MNRRAIDNEDPDRLYTVTGGRSRAHEASLDLVTLIVSECDPTPGMQSEYVKVLRMCRRPVAVVEIASLLQLPVGIVKVLLCDLLDTGQITARHPSPTVGRTGRIDPALLREVLVGLNNL